MADESEVETPAARLLAAVKGLPAKALPAVFAADVAAVAATVPPAKMSAVTAALAKGAAVALAGLTGSPAEERTCHPQAGDVRQLLEAAGVHAQ